MAFVAFVAFQVGQDAAEHRVQARAGPLQERDGPEEEVPRET